MLNREFVDGQVARRESTRSETTEQRACGVGVGGASASDGAKERGDGVGHLNGDIGSGRGKENGKGKAVEAIDLVSDSE